MDFAMFYAAAHALRAGANPYSPAVLHHYEVLLFARHGLSIVGQNVARVASPPIFFWGLQPLAALPFAPVCIVWMSFLYVLGLSGFIAGAHAVGGVSKRLILAFALSPLYVFAVYPGNVDAVVIASLGWGLHLARSHPFAAGAVLSGACLKPQIGLPLAILVAVFQSSSVRRALQGFACAAGVGVLFPLIVLSPTTVTHWLGSMTSFSNNITVVPDLTSLAGLYSYWPATSLRIGIAAACLGGAALVTVAAFRYWRPWLPVPLDRTAGMWCVWMIATPFAHYHDFAVLALPFTAVWVRREVSRWLLVTTFVLASVAAGIETVRVQGSNVGAVLVVVPLLLVLVAWTPRATRTAVGAQATA